MFFFSFFLNTQGSLRSPWVSILQAYGPYGRGCGVSSFTRDPELASFACDSGLASFACDPGIASFACDPGIASFTLG